MIQKQKKIFKTLLLLSCISISFSGCSKSKNSTSNEKAISAKAASTSTKKKSNITLYLGEARKLPSANKNTKYTNNSPKLISVSSSGTIHALKAGKATITTSNEKYSVTIKKHGFVYPSFSMMKGEHLDLQFNTKIKNVKWSSDNSKIASVSKKGIVHAKKTGKTIIKGIAGKTTYLCSLSVTKKIKSVIYLTFDDGPNRYSTPKILNILKKNNVKATFFELKPAKKDYDLTQRVLNEGHTLALHGYQHKYDVIYKSEKIYHQNLDKLRQLFFKKYGVWCTLSRFPGGSSNTCSRYNRGIMTRLSKKLDTWGYHYFDWNVSSGDAGGARNSKQVLSNIKHELVKGHSNVILMHDFYKNDKTINALDSVIKYGKKNGFVFRPLTASTTEIHHGINN